MKPERLKSVRLFLAGGAFFCLLLSSCNTSSFGRLAAPGVKNGALDLSGWDFEKDSIVSLDGQWEFYWRKLCGGDANQLAGAERHLIDVPDNWNDTMIAGRPLEGEGFATYRLKLTLPPNTDNLSIKMIDVGTAYTLYFNGKKTASNGRVAADSRDAVAQYLPLTARLTNIKIENEIIIEVSNYSHSLGGLWESVLIGKEDRISTYRSQRIWVDVFLAGSILIMSLYHFGLFALRRKDFSSLLFGAFCLLIVFRLFLTGERLFYLQYSDFNWEIGAKFEYLTIYLSAPIFSLFLYEIYPREMNKYVTGTFLAVSALLVLPVLIFPIRVFSKTLIPWEISLVLMCLWGLAGLFRATFRRQEGAAAALIGFVFFFAVVINDILFAHNLVNTGYWLPAGLFFFIFSQSFLLSLRFSAAFTNIERLSEDLTKTNQAYSRFVPNQFLNLLNKDSIIDIRLGDQIQNTMTVLFSDIRDFTEISETMSPKENFDFLNSYLKRMVPLIQKHNGFIDKYIGDSIMALFPDCPDDAVNAAAEMQHEISQYNVHRQRRGYVPISVGIGIHTGNLMLGTIGSMNRMEPTVISDAVNLASRIEGLTKSTGAQILISETTQNNLRDKDRFHCRLLGHARVKGKKDLVAVHQVLDGYPPDQFELYMKTRENFEQAVELIYCKEFDEAERMLAAALADNPSDATASIYIENCKKKTSHLAPETLMDI